MKKPLIRLFLVIILSLIVFAPNQGQQLYSAMSVSSQSNRLSLNAYSEVCRTSDIPSVLGFMSPLASLPSTSMVIKSTPANDLDEIEIEANASIQENSVQAVVETTQPANIPVEKPAVVTPERIMTVVPSTELDPFFEQYGAEYGVSSQLLSSIAYCESTFRPGVTSPNGLYGGLYQYTVSTWIATRRTLGLDENPELRFNAQEAIRTTAFKISAGGIGAWPHCGKKAQGLLN